jgi:hypothetical protein
MTTRRGKRKSPKVPFPRKQWQPGQSPRVEKPKKGGGYDRVQERRQTGESVEESADRIGP